MGRCMRCMVGSTIQAKSTDLTEAEQRIDLMGGKGREYVCGVVLPVLSMHIVCLLHRKRRHNNVIHARTESPDRGRCIHQKARDDMIEREIGKNCEQRNGRNNVSNE